MFFVTRICSIPPSIHYFFSTRAREGIIIFIVKRMAIFFFFHLMALHRGPFPKCYRPARSVCVREADPRRPAAASGKRTGLRGPRQALSAAAPSRRASLFVAVNRSQPADLPVPRLGTSTSSALAVSTPSVSGPGRGDGVTGLPRRSRSGEGGHLVVSTPSTCYGRHRPGSSLESGVVRREAAVPVTSARLWPF